MIIGLGPISLEIHSVINAPLQSGHTHICSDTGISPSGSLFIQILCAARSGSKTAIYTKIGKDLLSEYVMQIFRREGISQSFLLIDEDHQTPISMAITDTDQTSVIETALPTLSIDIDSFQNRFSYRTCLLLQAQNYNEQYEPLLERAHNAGAKVIFTAKKHESPPLEIKDFCHVILSEHEDKQGIYYHCAFKNNESITYHLPADALSNNMIKKIGFDVFSGSLSAALQAGFAHDEALNHADTMLRRIKNTANSYEAIPYIPD